MRILVVEDEASLREGLVDLLMDAGHTVSSVADGEAAVSEGLERDFDLVLLDLMLPRMDGFEVCRRLREKHPALGVLMLTARGDESDKVRGLRLGADDYITKPFGTNELLARIDSVARRLALDSGPEKIEFRSRVIDLGRCKFERDGTEQDLTAREANLLRFLHRHRERAVTRAELLENVWQQPGDLQTRTVDMCVANLRQKIEDDPARPSIVVTVKGVGYAWGEEA
ncbi:MAG: response regulator transcription factor [Gemmatimonadetes bacterium]|nr:response regulator transcription factor [Gemmatimonadota bacterium]